MLKGVPKIIPPELLKILAEMGHGDELTIGDANFPGHSFGKPVVRMDGHSVPEILRAILTLIPLDTFVDKPALLMEVVPEHPAETLVWDTYKEIVGAYDSRGATCFAEIDRYAFYDRAKQSSAIIMSGETALYANIILKKGVI